MTDLHGIHLAYVLSGFVVGLLVGMTGVGGGALMTPLLILLFDVHPVTAVGTDLLYASITKTVGSIVHGFNRNINWYVVRWLAAGSLPASVCTIAVLDLSLIDTTITNVFIETFLGVALLVTSLALLCRPRLLRTYSENVGILSPERTRNLTICTGIALGILVTITSVGAGALSSTALILLFPKLTMVRIVGTDLAHAVPLTLVAGLGHLFLARLTLFLWDHCL